MPPQLTTTRWGLPSETTNDPSPQDLRAGIESLDGSHRSALYLALVPSDLGTYLAVAGGSDNHFLVFISEANQWFTEAITPDAKVATIELVVDGQPGEFALRQLVTRHEAIGAALHYLLTGQPSPRLTWQKR
ncbi:MAG: hypothetical protein GY745_23460 [Actinomycetia bacterium]|nr:hypothetical protein [Actinomycetes bacterium]